MKNINVNDLTKIHGGSHVTLIPADGVIIPPKKGIIVKPPIGIIPLPVVPVDLT